jgi:ADP-ribose pyrophosphatase YjhB (NUDIX family)
MSSPATFPCVRCGTPLRRRAHGGSHGGAPAITCPRCRFLIFDYPRSCAGFIVTRGDRVLVLRRGHHPRRGMLDLPGGFMEANEGIEAAARRELLEETGLEVRGAEWFGFYWDRYYLRGFGYFPTMNFYFAARSTSGTPRAADDAAACEWAPIASLGRRGHRFAWKHMHEVVRDLRRLRRRGPR